MTVPTHPVRDDQRAQRPRPRPALSPLALLPAAPRNSLQAAATRITGYDRTGAKRAGTSKGAGTPGHSADWQTEAWEMYDLVGEQHFITNKIAGRISQGRLFVAQLKDGEPCEVDRKHEDAERLTDLVRAIGGGPAGLQQVLKRLALNLNVAGEGWLIGVPPLVPRAEQPDDLLPGEPERLERGDPEEYLTRPEALDWHALSVQEIRSSPNGAGIEVTLPDGPEEFDPDCVYLVRVWEPHPRNYLEADSASRSATPILRELVGLGMHTSAQTDSRLAGAGLLIVPQSISAALKASSGASPAGDGGEDAEEDQVTAALMDAMLEPIRDRASASAVVPLVMTVPDEAAEKIRHLAFSTPLDAEVGLQMERAIRRLALTQDAPPELLLGTSGMNHWGSWMVSEDTVSSHIAPPLALICDALTTQYLWPALVSQGYTPEDAQDYVIWFDVDHLIARPTAGADALSLYQAGELSATALRRTLGFDEADAPEGGVTPEGLVMVWLANSPNLLSNPGVATLLDSARALLGPVRSPRVPSPDTDPATAPAPKTPAPSSDTDAATPAKGGGAGLPSDGPQPPDLGPEGAP